MRYGEIIRKDTLLSERDVTIDNFYEESEVGMGIHREVYFMNLDYQMGKGEKRIRNPLHKLQCRGCTKYQRST